MKIRIKGNSVRLRITKSEVEQIAKGQPVVEIVEFPGNSMSYKICASQSSTVSFRDGLIGIEVETSVLEKWSNSEEIGIEFSNEKIKVLIEKDFACLITRDGEDDADAFPNPHAAHAG